MPPGHEVRADLTISTMPPGHEVRAEFGTQFDADDWSLMLVTA
jgi:hypothetical protein